MYEASDVTVVIPTSGERSVELHRAIKSVSDQTSKVYELVVVWDGEPNLLLDTIKELAGLRIICTKTPYSGVAKARQIGIRDATSRLIAILDDDDYWVEEKIETQIESLREHDTDENVFVFSKTYLQFENGKIKTVVPTKKFTPGEDFSKFLFSNIHPKSSRIMCSSSTYLFSKKLVDHFPFDSNLQADEDTDFILRIQSYSQIIFVPKPLVYTTIRKFGRGGLSHTKRSLDDWLNWTGTLSKVVGIQTVANIRIVYGVRVLAVNGEYRKSFKLWLASLKEGPDLISSMTGLLTLLRYVMVRRLKIRR